MFGRIESRSDEKRDSSKDQTKVTKKTKDFATGQGLGPSTLERSASHGSRDSSSEKMEARDSSQSPDAKKSEMSDAGSRLSLEQSQERASQERVAWSGQRESIPVYTPGRWEKSKLKKIYVDRAVAVWRELAKGHPERIWRRSTGNIPNEELYRFFKHADLKPGTYIDLGAGGGNFIHALGKIIPPGDTQIYAIDKDKAAYDKLQKIAPENVKVKALQADYTKEHFFKDLRNNEGISDASGILWANNGHYYSPPERAKLMEKMKSMLNDGGKLMIVEYNTFKKHGPDGMYNKYPLPKEQLKIELERAGFENVKFLRKLPSSDQYMMYSAIADAPKRSEDKDDS